MAVWSEVDLYDVAPASRFDSEYFDPYFLMIEEKLKKFNSKPLNKIADYINRGLQPQYDVEGTIKALRSVNIRDGVFSETRQEYVSQEFYNNNPRGQVKTNDILISSTGVGTLGRVLLNNQLEPLFADGHITIVRDIENRNLHFLSLFLQSKIGFALITRRQRGSSGQIEIYPDDIGSLPIPRFDDSIENEIGNNYIQALSKIKSSETLYKEAEALLLHELGLDVLNLSDEITYERNFDEVIKSGRIDAEYFHPEKKEVQDALAKMAGLTVGEHFSVINDLINPQSKENQKNKDVIVQNYDLDESLQFFLDNIEQMNLVDLGSAKKAFQKGDVVVSRLRSYLKEIAIVKSSNYCVGSSEYIVLRNNNSIVSPELLTVYLRSSAVQKILKWSQDGSNHPRFKEMELLAIKIPDKLISIQDEIIDLLKGSIDSITQAKQLLEDAKRRVEDIILGA